MYAGKMKYDNAVLILATMEFKCPLCNAKYHQKFNMRSHLKSKHTNFEAEKLINSFQSSK